MGKMPEAQNFLIPPRMLKTSSEAINISAIYLGFIYCGFDLSCLVDLSMKKCLIFSEPGVSNPTV